MKIAITEIMCLRNKHIISGSPDAPFYGVPAVCNYKNGVLQPCNGGGVSRSLADQQPKEKEPELHLTIIIYQTDTPFDGASDVQNPDPDSI
jgi:hypothetical protein